MDAVLPLEALIGGLVGSLLTIVVSRLFTVMQKSRDHRFALERSFFERKLQAGENAMSQWHATASLLNGIMALYERITIRERELEYELFRVTNDSLITQWQKVSQTVHDLANTIVLYFDTDENTYITGDQFKKLLERLASIRSLDVSLKFALDLYDKFKGSRQEEIAWNEVKRIIEEYQSNLVEITYLFNEAQKEMVDVLQKMRKEVKKFEPR